MHDLTYLLQRHQGDATMADVGDRCPGSLRIAGQDKVMAIAAFDSAKKPKANGKSWLWQCMSVVPVTESGANPILYRCI